jgi:hypothetical protein
MYGVFTNCTGKDIVVRLFECWCANDRTVLMDIFNDAYFSYVALKSPLSLLFVDDSIFGKVWCVEEAKEESWVLNKCSNANVSSAEEVLHYKRKLLLPEELR